MMSEDRKKTRPADLKTLLPLELFVAVEAFAERVLCFVVEEVEHPIHVLGFCCY